MVHPADPAQGCQSGHPDEPGDEAGFREANGFAGSVDLLIDNARLADFGAAVIFLCSPLLKDSQAASRGISRPANDEYSSPSRVSRSASPAAQISFAVNIADRTA